MARQARRFKIMGFITLNLSQDLGGFTLLSLDQEQSEGFLALQKTKGILKFSLKMYKQPRNIYV